jgi:Zn-dependent protease with chaperone function
MSGKMRHVRVKVFFVGLFLIAGVSPAFAQRTKLKPGMNSYSPQQDVALGAKYSAEVEKQSPLCNDPKVDAYLTKLGMRLVDHLNTFGATYPWEFHCVNDKAINAFALPGGYVFVNRGAIEAADYEAELAAVMAHELSHVALRHGTNQATKAQYVQMGSGIAGIAGSILGGIGGAAISSAGQLGAGSVLLKYSRGAETQADVMGTQVLYDSGYDPRAMAAFFEKLNNSKAPPEFFSDHPNPENRVDRVSEEIRKLGGAPPNAQKDSAEFEAIKKEVMALPVVPKAQPASSSATANLPKAGAVKVQPPSKNYGALDIGLATLKYPDNWKKYGNGKEVTLAPDGGAVDGGRGQAELAYGVMISLAKMDGTPPADQDALSAATQKLITSMEEENADLKITRDPKEVTLNGERALSTYFGGDSPGGGPETDWLITVMRPEGLVYFVCVAPRDDYHNFSEAFTAILDSVRFKR